MKAELVGGFGPRHFFGETRTVLAVAIRAGVAAATEGLKLDLRDEVRGRGLGNQLANAIGSKLYPTGKGRDTLHPAGIVHPRGRLATRIFDALNEGAPIRALHRRYLAVPTRNAFIGGRGGRRPSPEKFMRETGIKLRAVPSRRRSNVVLLIGPKFRGRVKGNQDIVYFVLVPIVRPGPRLDFAHYAQRWADRIPALIERATPSS